MKNKYFDGAHKWQEKDVNTVGLPRPFATPTRKDLAKKVPIPWQSEDRFDSEDHLGLNIENEKNIYNKDLCPYCGIKIKQEEVTIRWVCAPLHLTKEEGPKVFSDFHPFHLECMKQGRIFCPFMRKLKDEQFKIDIYKNLKKDAWKDHASVKDQAISMFIRKK